MEEMRKTLEKMRESIKCMNSENDYKYSDGWRDGVEFAIDKIERMIQA